MWRLDFVKVMLNNGGLVSVKMLSHLKHHHVSQVDGWVSRHALPLRAVALLCSFTHVKTRSFPLGKWGFLGRCVCGCALGSWGGKYRLNHYPLTVPLRQETLWNTCQGPSSPGWRGCRRLYPVDRHLFYLLLLSLSPGVLCGKTLLTVILYGEKCFPKGDKS